VEDGVVVNGRKIDVDLVIAATGFQRNFIGF